MIALVITFAALLVLATSLPLFLLWKLFVKERENNYLLYMRIDVLKHELATQVRKNSKPPKSPVTITENPNEQIKSISFDPIDDEDLPASAHSKYDPVQELMKGNRVKLGDAEFERA